MLDERLQVRRPGYTTGCGDFMIHATHEPGAEKYFLGFRVVIGCKDGEELTSLVRVTRAFCCHIFRLDCIPLGEIEASCLPKRSRDPLNWRNFNRGVHCGV